MMLAGVQLLAALGWLLSPVGAGSVQEATIRGHNAHRPSQHKLAWDAKLAQDAKGWAAKCMLGHHGFSSSQGENMYYASPKNRPDDSYIRDAVGSWMREKDWKNRTHYTQVVSAKSKRVGCAVQSCTVLKDTNKHVIAKNAALVVCRYSPAGNHAVNG